MTTAPTFAFDCDGTLVDFFSTFKAWMEKEKGHTTPHTHEAVKDYDTVFADMYPHLPVEWQRPLIGEFLNHPHFSKLQPLEGALEAVAHIRALHPGARFVALSSIAPVETVVRARREHLIPFGMDDFIPVGAHASKAEALARINATVFFDDHHLQIADAEAKGIRAVLVDQPWNRAYSVQHRLKHWRDVKDFIPIKA